MAEQLNLVQKLASIRRELKNIEKKGHNKFQDYDFLRAEDIAGEMGDRLAAMNVIVARRNLSFVQDNITIKKENGDERTDVHVIVTLDYVFLDGDEYGGELTPDAACNRTHFAEVVVSSIGEGRDSGDKAVAKAMTNALKYALTQPLMMRIGDDPEADAPHDQPEKRKPDNARVNPYISQNGQPVPLETAAGSVKNTRIALIKKAKDKLGDEMGLKWLKEAARDLGKTSEKLTIDEMLALSERITKLAALPSQDPITEDSDIPF
jgi:hypothetical protein